MERLTQLLAGLTAMLTGLAAQAADITTTEVFTPGQTVRYTNLNNIISGATIGPAFITGKSAATTAGAVDKFVFYSTSAPGLRQITTSNLWASLWNLSTNTGGYWPARFTSGLIALTALTNNPTTNIAHGLPGTPSEARWVLYCNATDLGFVVGDEVETSDVAAYDDTATQYQVIGSGGANTTNVFFSVLTNHVTGYYVTYPVSGTMNAISAGKWRLKCYAVYRY